MFVPLTPLRCLHRAQDVFGNRVGVISGDRTFTYAEFGERCELLATGLAKLGIQSGDRVALLSFNNHQLLESYYGVVQARGVVMPLNVRLSEVELATILNHSGARMLIFESDFAPLAEKLKASCPKIGFWVGMTEKVGPAGLTYEEIVAMGHPGRADIFTYDELAPAEMFYTSGSTGVPKGVVYSHRTLYLHALYVALEYDRPNRMVELQTIPYFHANGWGRPQASVMLGTKQILVRRFDPVTVFRLIQEHRATEMCLVPTMANALIHSPERTKYDLTSLEKATVGGAASTPEFVQRFEEAFPGCRYVAGYGLTETTPVIALSSDKSPAYPSEEERRRKQSMAGWPINGATVRVVDPEMNEVPRDMKTMGEIVVMGDQVMDGYYNEPEATQAAMTGPWLHTGDMAIWDEDSYLQIVDRKKEIIISGGENISSIEVEKAIYEHPSVLECAVVAAPDEKWGEVPAAIIVCKPGEEVSEEAMIAHLTPRLGRYKIPRLVVFEPEPLPKTGTGKIRKNILKERFWSGKTKRVQG